MELLVYVRNHGGRHAGSTYVGASVGESPSLGTLEMRDDLSSSAEFRVEGCVDDPVGELRRIVHQLFEMIGDEKYGRAIYLARPHSAIRVELEPGFDTPFDISHELAEMLAMCSPKTKARVAQSAEAQPPAFA